MSADLFHHIDVELDAHPATDPASVARTVANTAEDQQLRDLLAEALVDVVRRRIAIANTRTSKLRDPNRSILNQRMAVGPGQWKLLGDCTPTDLRSMARFRRAKAAEQEEWHTRFVRLADAVAACGAGVVAELPLEAVERSFNPPPP